LTTSLFLAHRKAVAARVGDNERNTGTFLLQSLAVVPNSFRTATGDHVRLVYGTA
jgi:hypothetical protein